MRPISGLCVSKSRRYKEADLDENTADCSIFLFHFLMRRSDVFVLLNHQFLITGARIASEFSEHDDARFMISMVMELRFMAAMWRHLCSVPSFYVPSLVPRRDEKYWRALDEQRVFPFAMYSILLE